MDYSRIYVELQAERPDELARFYEAFARLQRVSESPTSVTLSGATVTLVIKRGVVDPSESPGAGFGFVVSPQAAVAAREEAVAAGAIVVSESKRGDRVVLSCADPAGNEFSLVVLAGDVALEAQHDARASDASTRELPAARGAAPQTPPPPAATRTGPTRRDWDQLRDVERLAKMQEAIAGLDSPFDAADPAAVMSEMRAKIGASDYEERERLLAAEAEARARQREADREDLLARYKAQLGEPPPASPSWPAPEGGPGPSTDADDIALEVRPARRSLGRESDDTSSEDPRF